MVKVNTPINPLNSSVRGRETLYLTSAFNIDIFAYVIESNHYHQVSYIVNKHQSKLDLQSVAIYVHCLLEV